jgi:DNA-directed RNA polymerase subunit RPC12/RpoP
MVTVTKFATASKVKCSDCKNGNPDIPPEDRPPQYPQWGDVNDRELRNLTCLSCGHDLELLAVTKSDMFGDVIYTQCPHCFLKISISEQNRRSKFMCKKTPLNHMSVEEHDAMPPNGEPDEEE